MESGVCTKGCFLPRPLIIIPLCKVAGKDWVFKQMDTFFPLNAFKKKGFYYRISFTVSLLKREKNLKVILYTFGIWGVVSE